MLTELTTFHRDVLALQTGAVRPGEEQRLDGARLVNAGIADRIRQVAESTTCDRTVRRIDAILEARTALETNVAPQLAMEALLVDLVRRV